MGTFLGVIFLRGTLKSTRRDVGPRPHSSFHLKSSWDSFIYNLGRLR